MHKCGRQSTSWSYNLPLPSIFVNRAQQVSRRCRDGNLAPKDFMTVYIATIHCFVTALVRLHNGTVKAHTSEYPLGA